MNLEAEMLKTVLQLDRAERKLSNCRSQLFLCGRPDKAAVITRLITEMRKASRELYADPLSKLLS